MKRVLALLIASLTLALALTAGHAAPAAAYGTETLYQVTFSFNCDSRTSPFCAPFPNGFGLGGEWGWLALNGTPGATAGEADAQVTFCAHQDPVFGTGAGHFNGDTTWSIVTVLPNNLPPGTPLDPNNKYISVPLLGGALLPATAGHYALKFGPGVSGEVTIVLMQRAQ